MFIRFAVVIAALYACLCDGKSVIYDDGSVHEVADSWNNDFTTVVQKATTKKYLEVEIVDNICAAIPDNIGELGGAVFWDIVSQLPRGWETNVISGNIKFRSFAKAKTDGSARAILKVFLKRDSAENSQKNRKQWVEVADARAMTDGEGLISFQLTSPLAFGEGTTGVALVCDNCQFQYENGNEINQEFKTDDYSLVANGAQSLPFISDVIAGRSWPFCIGDIKLNQCWNKKCGCPGDPAGASWCRWNGEDPHTISGTNGWCNLSEKNCNKCSGISCPVVPYFIPADPQPTGKCWHKDCGCPKNADAADWCTWRGKSKSDIDSKWCNLNADNCGNCNGEYCPYA